MRPLEGILVLEFAQYLAAPSAAMRLADLGARVIKIEPGAGDSSRKLSLSDLWLDGDSVLFHAINRNKQSYSANLKDVNDLNKVKQLIAQADVLIENFRPGTMKRLRLDYDIVKKMNSRIIYGSVTGYGSEGPWKDKPGQDLLVQAISGMPWLNGSGNQPPVPFGVSLCDMFAGAYLVQGILAALVRRGVTGEGGRVEVNLLESALDTQFEFFTTYLNDGEKLPSRSKVNGANAYLGAPYGIYETQDGYIALAMGPIPHLGKLLACPKLTEYQDNNACFTARDEIKTILVEHLKQKTTKFWLSVLEPADYWCAEVYDWDKLSRHDGFKHLEMVQEITRPSGASFRTTRCPIRIDDQKLFSEQPAPKIGEHNQVIDQEFHLKD